MTPGNFDNSADRLFPHAKRFERPEIQAQRKLLELQSALAKIEIPDTLRQAFDLQKSDWHKRKLEFTAHLIRFDGVVDALMSNVGALADAVLCEADLKGGEQLSALPSELRSSLQSYLKKIAKPFPPYPYSIWHELVEPFKQELRKFTDSPNGKLFIASVEEIYKAKQSANYPENWMKARHFGADSDELYSELLQLLGERMGYVVEKKKGEL